MKKGTNQQIGLKIVIPFTSGTFINPCKLAGKCKTHKSHPLTPSHSIGKILAPHMYNGYSINTYRMTTYRDKYEQIISCYHQFVHFSKLRAK